MKTSIRVESLADPSRFRRRRDLAWKRNAEYWLKSPLRHVLDVGDEIVDRVEMLCRQSRRSEPVVLDVGCGNAWLLRKMRRRAVSARYIGVDNNAAFIEHCRSEFSGLGNASFELADLERRRHPQRLGGQLADVAVSSFVFFELHDLDRAFLNVSGSLRAGGALLVSVIDKTYLLLALSRDWADFHQKLERYQTLPGIKYAFQPIDLGDGYSKTLVYPSVLYSTEDYINAGRRAGFVLHDYHEQVFTAKPIPKIYNHFEFKLRGRTT